RSPRPQRHRTYHLYLQSPFTLIPFTLPFSYTDPAPTEISTLSLHDALPISMKASCGMFTRPMAFIRFLPSFCFSSSLRFREMSRSEEHTSELQSPYDLVCRLLLEKKKKTKSHRLSIKGKFLPVATLRHLLND